MLSLEGEWILHRHTDYTPCQTLRLHRGAGPKEHLDATDFIPVDGGPKVEPRPVGGAIDQQEGQTHL